MNAPFTRPQNRAAEVPSGSIPPAAVDAAHGGNPIVAPDRLAQIVRPFVGTFRSIHRGDSALDILHVMNSIDVDVRKVDASGVELQRDGFATVVPWASVKSVTVRGIEDGRTVNTIVYENAAATHPLRSHRAEAA